MMKRIIVLLIAVCMLAAVAIAQTAAPAPAPSTTPQAAAPTQTARPARTKGKHAGRHAALRDIDDPRVKELVARHHTERRACKANPSAAGCAEMLTRQKSERRALMMQLRKEGKI
jgi:hypothetical protein